MALNFTSNKHCFACPRPASYKNPGTDIILPTLSCNGYIAPFFFTEKQAMAYLATLTDDVKKDVITKSFRLTENPDYYKDMDEGMTSFPDYTVSFYLFSDVSTTTPDQAEVTLTIHFLPCVDAIEKDIFRAIKHRNRVYRFSTKGKPLACKDSPTVIHRSVSGGGNGWESTPMGAETLLFNKAVAEIKMFSAKKAHDAHAN